MIANKQYKEMRIRIGGFNNIASQKNCTFLAGIGS